LHAQAEAVHPVHIIGLELNLSHLPDDTTHITGSGREDAGVTGLDAMLCGSSLVWVVLLQCCTNVGLTSLTGDFIYLGSSPAGNSWLAKGNEIFLSRKQTNMMCWENVC
jgi:hypothetical protein